MYCRFRVWGLVVECSGYGLGFGGEGLRVEGLGFRSRAQG